MRKQIMVVMGMMLVALASSAQVAPPKEDLIAGPPKGPWRRLFLDAMVVEQQDGLARIFHAAEKYDGNPVIRKDRPWEGRSSYSGPYLYGTVMWDEGRLRMWYHCHDGGYRNCYAESTDGIHWTKPNLGLREFDGSKDNNLYLTVTQDPNENPLRKSAGQCHNASVIKRPWEPDPNKRYVLFCYGVDYRKARAAFSPDGLRWTFVPETAEKALFPSADVLNFFYDPYRRRYVATIKTSSRRGRAATVGVSRDGLQWEMLAKGPVMVADDLDPDATQIYGMPVFPYQGLYIGQAWIYNSRWFKYGGYTDQRMYEVEKDSPCTMDVQLAWSWDLINWTRTPERGQFIPRGKKGEFDSDMIYTATAPVQVNDQLYFYYGGWAGAHNSGKAKANIGLAILRLDGFCSMQAGEKEGWLISRREVLAVPKVTINAKTEGDGYVVGEILDANNNVLKGFSRDECIPFKGDSVRHVLEWKTKALDKSQIEGDKKFRFFLKNANLYSYLPDPTPPPSTVIYDPSKNGGRLPWDKRIPVEQQFGRGGIASGFKVVKEGNLAYLDMHSVASAKTRANAIKSAVFYDDTDWCVEAWYRLADKGDEPNYGLATFVNSPNGRNASIYMSDKEVGILSTDGGAHKVLKAVPMDTTDGFHWYRLVHTGGSKGDIALHVDGKEVIHMPYTNLHRRDRTTINISFGPNAAHREGRLHVAKFGYRIGSTDPIFGPVNKSGVGVTLEKR
ncbi:MAG: hypothetical protein GXP25_03140 [Planctomycetes bacterium]|nr:hypothetical protein [Planctomycetota bacterium]